MFDNEKYNQGVRDIGKNIESKLKQNLSSLGIHSTGKLFKVINIKYKENYGNINALGVTIYRYGVFVEKGVGRGVPIDSAKQNAGLLGGRYAKAWFNPVMDEEVPKLADFVMSQNSDMLLKAIKIN